jgi:outer membrane biosynthesis protein TonB
MRNSVYLSAAAHASVIVLALVAFPSPEELPPVETRALPVELVTVDEMTNLMSTKKVDNPKPVEKPEPPKPEEPEKPKPEEPKPEPKPVPPQPEEKVEPVPEEKVEKKEEKPVEKKVEKPTPPKKEPPKKTFDAANIAQLLDKAPDTAPKAEAVEAKEDFQSPTTDDPSAALTMSETDALRQRIEGCWKVRDLMGNADADKFRARLRILISQDGQVIGKPSIVDISNVTGSRVFAERAISAVLSCAPYDFLPANKYSSWRENVFTFTMSGMM